ncbi:hypothetical protein [Flavobacterium alkalisoli]|uniref:hypothetical protein n=1 Tax=Flavobacterium alkalisoli TaxID=2602769 RepID=UPI003A8DE5A9
MSEIKIEVSPSFSSAKLYCLTEGGMTAEFEEKYKFEEVEGGQWEDDGKYSHSYSVVKCVKSPNVDDVDRYFGVADSRSGSYHTDYYYGTEYDKTFTIKQVREVTKTITTWEEI